MSERNKERLVMVIALIVLFAVLMIAAQTEQTKALEWYIS